MKDNFDELRASAGSALRTALYMINQSEGVEASTTDNEEIHIKFDISYKSKTICKYFVKLKCLPDGSWQVFSLSLPHYLPMSAILINAPYNNPVEISEDIRRFLESLAQRKGQVLEVKALYPAMLKITNTATYDLVRLSFKKETEFDLLRGAWFDLKYTLLANYPAQVNVTLPERTRRNLTRENQQDLEIIIKGLQTYSIAQVMKTIVE